MNSDIYPGTTLTFRIAIRAGVAAFDPPMTRLILNGPAPGNILWIGDSLAASSTVVRDAPGQYHADAHIPLGGSSGSWRGRWELPDLDGQGVQQRDESGNLIFLGSSEFTFDVADTAVRRA